MSESPVRRHVLWAVLSTLLSVGAIWAGVAGFFPRLNSAAPFLVVWAATALYLATTAAIRERRAHFARTLPVPYGIPLRVPFWVRFGLPVYVAGWGAKLAAIAAACGLETLGGGILIASVILAVPFFLATRRMGVVGVSFEPVGLRAYVAKDVTFFVPWGNIAHVEAFTRRKVVLIQLREPDSVRDSLDPDTPRTRARLSMLALDGRGRLMLAPWLGCLDSSTLERAIRSAVDQHPIPNRTN